MAGSAAEQERLRASDLSRRVALWVCLLVLPILYELSGLLPAVGSYYSGAAWDWYAGAYVRLALAGLALAVVAWAVLTSGKPWSAIGWPGRIPWWQAAALIAMALAAVAVAVLFHPQHVSTQIYKVAASTPVNLQERCWLLAVAFIEAPVQELVWRGALIRWLQPTVGTGGAVLLSSASFIFLHPGAGLTWHGLRTALPLTAIYVALFLWRRSIGPSAVLHFVVIAGQLLSPVG